MASQLAYWVGRHLGKRRRQGGNSAALRRSRQRGSGHSGRARNKISTAGQSTKHSRAQVDTAASVRAQLDSAAGKQAHMGRIRGRGRTSRLASGPLRRALPTPPDTLLPALPSRQTCSSLPGAPPHTPGTPLKPSPASLSSPLLSSVFFGMRMTESEACYLSEWLNLRLAPLLCYLIWLNPLLAACMCLWFRDCLNSKCIADKLNNWWTECIA